MTNSGTNNLLRLVARFDVTDAIWWDEGLNFFVNCNDAFFWGSSDSEEIIDANLPLFEKALVDAEEEGPLLYCARLRGMRPQGAMYKLIERKNWHLFDACGPEREPGPGNPLEPEKHQ